MIQSESTTTAPKQSRVENLYKSYNVLEESINVDAELSQTTYRSPVNFIESMQHPRHRWFPYKEGFSPTFVRQFLKEFDNLSGGLVVDPFSGSGTTAIVAGELGFSGIGFDVSPLTSFVATTKTITMNSVERSEFRAQIEDFSGCQMHGVCDAPDNETVRRYFSPEFLDVLLRVKFYFAQLANEKHHDLFKLAFLAAIEPFSTHRKAGNGVKRKTKRNYPFEHVSPTESVRMFILERLNEYADDIALSEGFVPPTFRLKSSLDRVEFENLGKISAVLTSPPYANCFDYSKIYMSELWLGDFFSSKEDQVSFRQNSVRSHVHASWNERHTELGSSLVDRIIRPHIDEQDLWSNRIGSMLSGYFQDLGKLLVEIKPFLQTGAPLGFVVGNSFYGGIAVATDLLLAQLARQHGYEVETVRVYRGVVPSSQQYKLLGENRKYMRESLVVVRNT